MAGIIGASLNEFGIGGVAPEAEMIALRACRQVVDQYPEAGCTTASVAKVIDTAIEKRARVINMSFGSAASDKLIFKLIEEGSKRGILFVAVVLSELGDLVNPTQLNPNRERIIAPSFLAPLASMLPETVFFLTFRRRTE